MKLNKEDYKKAVGCLKRYNYNYITIINIRDDIMRLNPVNYSGMPHSMNAISNVVLDKVIQLQENEMLNNCIKEYKAVIQALQLVNEDSKIIFEQIYIKSKLKWDVLDLGMSERTFFRRKKDLIVAVHKELKKIENLS